MNRANFAAHQRQLMEELFKLREEGQKEYAHDDSNAFRNFESLAKELEGMDPTDRKTVLWVYFVKHLDGIRSYLRGHRSQRESIHGRIKDCIVYLTLLDGMITEDEIAEDMPGKGHYVES